MSFKKRIIAVTPMLCAFTYLLIGFVWGVWHPTWLIFLLIPAMPILLGSKKIKFSIPFIITIIYIIIGITWRWHPTWLIFILIPVFEILITGKD